MSYETLINEMLDKIDQRQTMCGVRLPDELESKDSIVERYFKKVSEDTKKKCINFLEATDDADYKYTREEVRDMVKKL